MLDTMVSMIAGGTGRDGSADSRSSGSSSDGALVAAPGGRLVMLKRKSADEDEMDGAAQSKKVCTETDSASESSSESEDARGSIRFLSSLTNVIIKPAQKPTPTYTGVDEWVPKEMEEIAEFPMESVDKYKKVHPNVEAPKKFMLLNGEFSVVASLEKLTEEMNLRASENSPKQHKQQDSREERLTKNELTDNEDQKKKKEKEAKEEEEMKRGDKVLYHLAITLYNEKNTKYVMSLYRSHKLADVVALCERCRENPELFRVFPKNVNIKEYLHLIFMELRDNMTWKSVHISSKIGLLEFFENMSTS